MPRCAAFLRSPSPRVTTSRTPCSKSRGAQVMGGGVAHTGSLWTGAGAVHAHLALVHAGGRVQPLPFHNAGLPMQDLERLAATVTAQIGIRGAAPEISGAPPVATPVENDTLTPAIIDLDAHAAVELRGGGSGARSLAFFQRTWLHSVSGNPALLAAVPPLATHRVRATRAHGELHVAVEPHRGMRPAHGVAWAAVAFVVWIFSEMVLVFALTAYLLSLPTDEQDPLKHLRLITWCAEALRVVHIAAYVLGLTVLGAPRTVSITVARDRWRVDTALRVGLGRQVWRKIHEGATGELVGCQVRSPRSRSLVHARACARCGCTRLACARWPRVSCFYACARRGGPEPAGCALCRELH